MFIAKVIKEFYVYATHKGEVPQKIESAKQPGLLHLKRIHPLSSLLSMKELPQNAFWELLKTISLSSDECFLLFQVLEELHLSHLDELRPEVVFANQVISRDAVFQWEECLKQFLLQLPWKTVMTVIKTSYK